MRTPPSPPAAVADPGVPVLSGGPGFRNRQVAWWCATLGALTGLLMGLWSFDGPVPVPAWLGDYGSTARRLARLGHIAFFGLAILNLLLAGELDRVRRPRPAHRLASVAMNFGNVGLPRVLFGAAAWMPLKYLLPIPALAVTLALLLTGLTLWPSRNPPPVSHENPG
ncbi:MAG: hypothetical protein ACKO3N_15130 [Verrucomicrobiota bacterium]